jgi:hypothetical protein
MSQEVADRVRGLHVVAVSDAFRLAPWADAMCSSDAKWWAHNPAAKEFAGLKFTASPDFRPVAGVERMQVSSGTNSGLLGIMVAVNLGAKRVLLCGFDMRGAHYFGKHPEPLKNTTEARYQTMMRQFRSYRPRGVKIINCTPGSSLNVYPLSTLEDCLA